MGSAHSVHSEIEISRPPAEVRAVFLDFDRYPEWHDEWTLASPYPKKPPSELQAGDKIILNRTVLSPGVLENSPNAFRLKGDFSKMLYGHHQVYFKPSQETPDGTWVVVHEDFTGVLSFALREGSRRGKSCTESFDRWNAKLKARVEGLAS